MHIYPSLAGLELRQRRTIADRSRSARGVGVVLLAGILLATGHSSGQGLLQGLREGVRSAGGGGLSSEDADHDHSPKQRGEHCDDGSGWLDDEFGSSLVIGVAKLTFWTATSPVWLPKTLLDDPGLDPAYFARYPYHGDLDGFIAPDPAPDPWQESDRYGWLLRWRGEVGGDLDDLSRAGGQVLLDTASRWGVDLAADYFREQLPADRRDRLWLGDANVVYRFAQSPQLQMRTGVGLNWLSDDYGCDLGFNFTYGGDFFPVDPWILSAEIDWGRLGHAGLFHGRATVGVHFHRVEIYTGYDYLDVGRSQINSLVSGVRVWY